MTLSDDERWGPEIVHFDCIKFMNTFMEVQDEHVTFGSRGEEVVWPVFDGLVGDPGSDLRNDTAENAASCGLAALYSALLGRPVHIDDLPYYEVDEQMMRTDRFKHVMMTTVWDAVVEYMRHSGVSVVNDGSEYLL